MNLGYFMAGDIVKESAPYYPFHDAGSAWARSFAAPGIKYEQNLMNLDLCGREMKYSNGVCQWPQGSYVKGDGNLAQGITNLTSLAIPSQAGSEHTALTTLMHEGGHAARFANIRQPSPFLWQERAPMHGAFAENQSMFLDSLVGDAAWLGRYATSIDGHVMPGEVVEKKICQTHDF